MNSRSGFWWSVLVGARLFHRECWVAVAHARFYFTEGQSRGVPRGNTRLSDHVAFGLVYPLSSIIRL